MISTLLLCFMLQYPSINQIFNSQSVGKRIRHLIKGRIPKMDAVRELLSQLDPKDLTQVNDSVVKKIRKNKTFQKGTIDGYTVVAIDGVELFSSHKKSCEACLIRKHRNGTIDYFHRSVVCMSVGSDPHIILGEDFLHPRDGAAKDEGENTGAKRLIERLYKEHHHFADIIVGDALYLNAPFINTVLSCGMDVVIRGKDENRAILKDAAGLFKQMACTGEFTKDKIKAQAKALGMSRNEMILKAITMLLDFEPTFYKKLEVYSSNANVSIGTALQNMTIKRWAQDNAKKSVWGADTDILVEFSQSNEGVIQPKELYELVYQMAFEEEARGRFEQLQQEVGRGLELRGEDKDFYEAFQPKYGYKPQLERESLQEGLTFWESDGDGAK